MMSEVNGDSVPTVIDKQVDAVGLFGGDLFSKTSDLVFLADIAPSISQSQSMDPYRGVETYGRLLALASLIELGQAGSSMLTQQFSPDLCYTGLPRSSRPLLGDQ